MRRATSPGSCSRRNACKWNVGEQIFVGLDQNGIELPHAVNDNAGEQKFTQRVLAMSTGNLEERLAQVEKELEGLKTQVETLKNNGNWIQAISGSARDDDEFKEILRLGKGIRDAEEPVEE